MFFYFLYSTITQSRCVEAKFCRSHFGFSPDQDTNFMVFGVCMKVKTEEC